MIAAKAEKSVSRNFVRASVTQIKKLLIVNKGQIRLIRHCPPLDW